MGKTIHNCTIVGNRRIGKTSILHEVKERLSSVYVRGKSIHFADLYASKCKSTWDAVYLILDQLRIQVPTKMAKWGAIAPRYVNRFPQILKEFSRTNETKIVILIDEFDQFLEIDSQQKYEFLNLLREAAMGDNSCAVLIAGFRRLMETRVRQESPYFNFTKEVTVGPLRSEETTEMVNHPLSRLGIIAPSDTSLAGVIHRETRGQPELIQMFCQAVVNYFEQHHRLPTDAALLDQIRRDVSFNRTILHTFLFNTNSYEQVLCLRLMLKAIGESKEVAEFEFKIKDVEEVAQDAGLTLTNEQTANVIQNLTVGSVLNRIQGAPGKYRFAQPQLLRYCKDVGVEQLLHAAERELGQVPLQVNQLNMEPLDDSGRRVLAAAKAGR